MKMFEKKYDGRRQNGYRRLHCPGNVREGFRMNRSSLFKYVWIRSLLLAGLLSAGCQHRLPTMDLQPPESIEPGGIDFTATDPVERECSASVAIHADPGHGRTAADIVEIRIQDSLAAMGLEADQETPDFKIDAAVRAGRVDRFGKFYIFSAQADTDVFGPPDLRRLARQSFSARSQRLLGEQTALKDAAGNLAGSLESWVADLINQNRPQEAACQVIAVLPKSMKQTPSDYGAALVDAISGMPGVLSCTAISTEDRTVSMQLTYSTVDFPNGPAGILDSARIPPIETFNRSVLTIVFPKRHEMSMAEYTILLVDTVSALKGIESCRAISRDAAARATQFEVIFDPDAFPEGLYNRIVTIDELGLEQQ
ncbi:hypothetical protein JXA40_07145 [bacterium]|nr:hypothetical protein [candidate division CSSED10-310 bacterium]